MTLVDRVVSKIVPQPHPQLDPCWVWTASVCNKGYAQFAWRENGKWHGKRAHIWLWEHFVGRPVMAGYTLDHLCLNKRCINPTHLEEVPRPVNTARGNRTRHGRPAHA